MYQVRFENESNEPQMRSIETKRDLDKLISGEAKSSIIECKISSGMPVSLHNAIAEHNENIDQGKT